MGTTSEAAKKLAKKRGSAYMAMIGSKGGKKSKRGKAK